MNTVLSPSGLSDRFRGAVKRSRRRQRRARDQLHRASFVSAIRVGISPPAATGPATQAGDGEEAPPDVRSEAAAAYWKAYELAIPGNKSQPLWGLKTLVSREAGQRISAPRRHQ